MPKQTKSILFFNPTGMIGGAEINLITMIDGLQKNGHNCAVVVPYHGPLSTRLNEINCKTFLIKEESILHGNPTHIISGLWQLRKIINSYDIIHSNSRFTLYLPVYAGWFFRKKVFIHWADYDILAGDRQLLNFRSKHVTIIAVSKSIKEYLVTQGVHENMITVVHNGCDEPKVTEDSALIRQKYHIAASQPVIAISGRIDSWKGHKTLLNAVSKIRNPHLMVLILGEFHLAKDPNLKEDILQLIASLSLYDNVIFTGFLENPANVLQCCDLICAPSEYEPFGLVAIEGMALKKVVLASNVGGFKESISNGESGLLLPPTDTDAWANAITGILENPEKAATMKEKAYTRYKEKFTSELFVDRVQSLYN